MSWDNNVVTSPDDSPAYRAPRQARGARKFERILDAAHDLLGERALGEFGLRDVAKHAGVASGSVYHFFPNNEVLYVALVDRYNRRFVGMINAPVDDDAFTTWHELISLHFENAREYMNSNAQARSLILGSGRSWQSRESDSMGDSNIANALVEALAAKFRLPEYPPPTDLVYLALRILEGFWELSVRQHDFITNDIARETTRAVNAYLGLYWPGFLEPNHDRR